MKMDAITCVREVLVVVIKLVVSASADFYKKCQFFLNLTWFFEYFWLSLFPVRIITDEAGHRCFHIVTV
jgi:hypothetical protein